MPYRSKADGWFESGLAPANPATAGREGTGRWGLCQLFHREVKHHDPGRRWCHIYRLFSPQNHVFPYVPPRFQHCHSKTKDMCTNSLLTKYWSDPMRDLLKTKSAKSVSRCLAREMKNLMNGALSTKIEPHLPNSTTPRAPLGITNDHDCTKPDC